MNYLISTFDGLGDGVMYYPVLRYLAINKPDDIFYCTNNILFSNQDISNKLNLPKNIKFVSEKFRKFSKDSWSDISNFLSEKGIEKIINLRFIGKKFEGDYFEFKNISISSNRNFQFFDSENIHFKKNVENAREVILEIFKKAIDDEFIYKKDSLSKIFPLSKTVDYIFINMHSRGSFKLWNIKKWSEIISLMIFNKKRVYIYCGYNNQEKEYTDKVLSNLNQNTKDKIEIVLTDNLLDLILFIQKTKLLISVDSGLVHLADALGVNSLGIYLTTNPLMWGGVTKRFHFVKSKHLVNCKNYYDQFGMCMNDKKKCEEILGDRDDIDINDISNIVNYIYEKED